MGFKIEKLLKDWLSPKDMKALDEAVQYLEELGEKAKNIKSVDDAYDFATELGMDCTREEFREGAEALEYIGKQIEQEEEKAAKKAEDAYLDAVAVYMTAEKRMNDAKAEYAKYYQEIEDEYTKFSRELEEEFRQNREKAPAYVENAARELEEGARKFYAEAQKSYEEGEKQLKELSSNIEKLGKRVSKVRTTKDLYKILTDLGVECSWGDFKKGAKVMGIFKD